MLFGESAPLFWPFVISHIYSFIKNFLIRREFRKTTVMRRMVSPYFRVFPQSILVIATAWFFVFVQPLEWAAFGLVALKTVADLFIHIALHRRLMNHADEDLLAETDRR